MARRRKKSSGGGGGGILVLIALLVILAILYSIPLIVGYLLYNKYKFVPSQTPQKKHCFILMLFAILILAAGSTMFIISIFTGYNNNIDYIIDKICVLETWYPMGIGIVLCIPFVIAFYISLRSSERQSVNQEQGQELYIAELLQALKNLDLSDEETNKLRSMAQQYEIPDEVISEIHQSVFLNFLYEIAEDLVVDANEVALLNHFSKALSVDDSQIDYANEFMSKVNKVSAILDGTIEGIEPPSYYIPKRGEICYFCEECELYENVTKTAYVGTSFGLGDILPRKLFLNPRIYAAKRVSYGSMKKIDLGGLVITNRRLAFIGDVISRDFTFKKIIGIDIGYDGIQINRSGKARKEVFRLNALDKDVAAALIMKLTRQS